MQFEDSLRKLGARLWDRRRAALVDPVWLREQVPKLPLVRVSLAILQPNT